MSGYKFGQKEVDIYDPEYLANRMKKRQADRRGGAGRSGASGAAGGNGEDCEQASGGDGSGRNIAADRMMGHSNHSPVAAGKEEANASFDAFNSKKKTSPLDRRRAKEEAKAKEGRERAASTERVQGAVAGAAVRAQIAEENASCERIQAVAAGRAARQAVDEELNSPRGGVSSDDDDDDCTNVVADRMMGHSNHKKVARSNEKTAGFDAFAAGQKKPSALQRSRAKEEAKAKQGRDRAASVERVQGAVAGAAVRAEIAEMCDEEGDDDEDAPGGRASGGHVAADMMLGHSDHRAVGPKAGAGSPSREKNRHWIPCEVDPKQRALWHFPGEKPTRCAKYKLPGQVWF